MPVVLPFGWVKEDPFHFVLGREAVELFGQNICEARVVEIVRVIAPDPMRMSFFCASFLRLVIPMVDGTSTHIALAARRLIVRNVILRIVLVYLFADISLVGCLVTDEENITTSAEL
jgi:hypothetical protein